MVQAGRRAQMDADRSRDGERRHATVLFADLSGFTALSEQRDPEDVATVVSGCLDALASAVHDHGGHVDKYIGDCVMAVFGVPHAAENAATNAINAAIDMRKRLENLNDAASDGVHLTLHVGINTGLVVSGDVGGAVKRGEESPAANEVGDFSSCSTAPPTQPPPRFRRFEMTVAR